jgi:putative endopeptidase
MPPCLPSRAAIVLVFGLVIASGCRRGPVLASGIDVGGMNTSVPPGDDFNLYANGGWLQFTAIPSDKARYGVFDILADQTRDRTRTLIQEASGARAARAGLRKIGDYYSSFMSQGAIEDKGIEPLKPKLDAIAAIADRPSLSRAIGGTLRADVDPLNNTNFETENLFGVWITQGLTDPSRSYPYLLQGGLGLPDREYYTAATPHMAELRKQYQAHVAAMLKLAGVSDPPGRADRIVALETKMANVHATRVESEDVHGAVTWKREELDAKAPGLDWAALLDAAGLKDAPEFIIWHPKAIPGLAALVAKEPLDSWKDWLTFHTIEQASPYLPDAFVRERFQFRGRALSGIPEIRQRWQRGVDLTSAALGDLVGKVYADRFFPPATKARVQAMVSDIIKAFGRRIDALAWMSPDTKARAKKKLETLKVGVGYPDRWVDYSGLEIVKDDALGNSQRAELFEYHRQLAKLGQPVDRGEWWMTPQTVNAVNLPLQNALNFPAAIIAPPYFDVDADAAHNYGSMGAIIGHEISHSFDDQGSQFDADGRLSMWWTKEDFEHFQAAGRGLAAQYDSYRPFPDLALNGKQTLGENIADLAGLLAAYDAYRLSLGGRSDRVKDGFTGDQRFFISYAQSWRSKARDAELRRAIITDGHAPGQYRALTVRNVDAWYKAFSPTPAQKLFLPPEQRVRVW